jgi:hypothetical protein
MHTNLYVIIGYTRMVSLRWEQKINIDPHSITIRRPHRLEGPAVIDYNVLGQLEVKKWCIMGKLHREYGPAKYTENVYIKCI